MATLKPRLLSVGLGLSLMGAGMAQALECSPVSSWSLQWERPLPRQGRAGDTIGGFSAIAYGHRERQLWLLSDLPQAELSLWGWPSPSGSPRLLRQRPINSSDGGALDGEGMVLAGDQLWMASEGRRTPERPPGLLRVNPRDGRTLQTVPLPPDWQAAPGVGLASNAGPESLTQLPTPGNSLELLMAAERPLLQDPTDQVRLLRWWWPAGRAAADAPQASPQGWLQLPEPQKGQGAWALTDLLALPRPAGQGQRLLALLRRFTPPQQWENHLALYPLPAPGERAAALQVWDLQAAGLTPDNWEGLALGPPQQQGGASLLLVSDDNLNPLQSSLLALITPKPPHACLTSP